MTPSRDDPPWVRAEAERLGEEMVRVLKDLADFRAGVKDGPARVAYTRAQHRWIRRAFERVLVEVLARELATLERHKALEARVAALEARPAAEPETRYVPMRQRIERLRALDA